MDPTKRLTELVELAMPRKFLLPSMSMDKCVQVLNELHQMGTFYAENGRDEERAFLMYLRYISIVVEELPRHPNFCLLSSRERHALDAQALQAMSKAEEMKRCLRQKYEQEHHLQKTKSPVSRVIAEPRVVIDHHPIVASTSTGDHQLPLGIEAVFEHQHQQHLLSPYVQCNCVSVHSIWFQNLIIPANLFQTLISTIANNASGTAAGDPPQHHHFGILYGRIIRQTMIVSQLLPCSPGDATQKTRDNLYTFDTETGQELYSVGCVCSSLELPSRMGFFRHSKMTEMVCIVCAPGSTNVRVLHLVDMSPNGGSAFHKIESNNAIPTTATPPPPAAANSKLMMMPPTCTHLFLTGASHEQQQQRQQQDREIGRKMRGGKQQQRWASSNNNNNGIGICEEDGTVCQQQQKCQKLSQNNATGEGR